ncbi:MAG TPA: 5'-3' exonuclease H3TH domain-containing protein, partial [Patescibacteria group bacterium]|nr:5'-3' exonuclease H3TH domain-containing protein [Patescibacteria group bacterium]
ILGRVFQADLERLKSLVETDRAGADLGAAATGPTAPIAPVAAGSNGNGHAGSPIPDLLALVGDAADGFPGLPGWGAKSAAAVLLRYGWLEAIPAQASDWDVPVRGAVSLAATLRDRRDEVFLYRTLARLRTDAPVGETSVDELRWRGAPRARWQAFCDEVGLARLRSRPHRWLADD